MLRAGWRRASVRSLSDEIPGRVVVAHPDLVRELAVLAHRIAAANLARIEPDDLRVVAAAAAVLPRDAHCIAALRARSGRGVAQNGAILPAGDLGDPALDRLFRGVFDGQAGRATERDVLAVHVLIAVKDRPAVGVAGQIVCPLLSKV